MQLNRSSRHNLPKVYAVLLTRLRLDIIPRYTSDEEIRPLSCLEVYIERTQELRQDNILFISTVKPHNPVGAQTMSRWTKTILEWADIDVTLFKPHSTRHAAAFQPSIPLENILKKAGWSSAKTFRRFISGMS